MKFSRYNEIRQLLQESKDGLTSLEIAERIGTSRKSIDRTLKNAWGIYIDRWTTCRKGKYSAIHMCVEVPPDTPHPES